MADAPRARKMADRIRVIVAETLERGVKDPRIGFVTITDTRLTPDLREATVFYTVFGDDVARTETAAALESAKGLLRSEVGRRTGVKFTPTLEFVADVVPETAAHVEDLLRRAAEADAEVQQIAATAVPVGEADPYRSPRGIEDEADDPAGPDDGGEDGHA
jgi:ribosome-binding factor A